MIHPASSLQDRLRTLAETLPEGGAVTLTREGLLGLLESPADVEASMCRDLTVEEVGREVGRAPSTVRSWLIAGELRGFKLNNRDWRVPPAALREYLDAQANGPRHAPTPPPAGGVDIGAWRKTKPGARAS